VDRRRLMCVGSVIWAAVGAGVAVGSIPNANHDTRVLVGLASVVFPLCALGAAVLLQRQHDRLAGLLLLASAATPTCFAYPLNVPALVVGLALLASPAVTLGEHREIVPAARQS
jgi:hypothetical protein